MITKLKLLLIVTCVLFIFSCRKETATPVRDTSQPQQPDTASQAITEEQRAFLDTLEHDTFNFFWETTNPQNGLTPDQYPNTIFSSIAAVGFSLSSYLVGVEEGYITRQSAADRTLTTLRFFWNAPQGDEATGVTGYKGFFYHFLDMNTGYRYKEVELSTIDTSLLLAGILSSQTYFDGNSEEEQQIRALADSIYRRADWTWFYSKNQQPLISMGWHPESGFLNATWSGYNEGMILYVLALGSPTHPINDSAWGQWTSTYNWSEYKGSKFVNFGPLFGHQYSHVWIDFRDIQDEYMREKGIDYFINSTLATRANRTYCVENPMGWKGYGKLVWGLTASDGPGYKETTYNGQQVTFKGYTARGVSADYLVDDGTIVPTAAGGSVPFTPKIAIPTLKYLHDAYGDKLYGEYGFKDAFNLTYTNASDSKSGWFDEDYLGIDQGPIILMIENYQSDFLWDLMKQNKYIRKGLQRAGFKGGWLDQEGNADP